MKKLAVLILLAAPVIGILGSNSANNASPKGNEWQLVWEENFEGNTYDTTIWSKIPRGHVDWNNYMSSCDSLFDVSDGKLYLYGIANTCCTDDTAKFITGGLYTKDKKSFGVNGRLEISAKMNDVKGAWPAIWLMPFNQVEDWPMCGEIDIMERLNYDSIAYQTVHSNYTYNLGRVANPPSSCTLEINPRDFNTYGVEMYPDSVVFYINGNRNFAYPRIETDQVGQFPFNKDWYLMLDMQLGGRWVGAIDPNDLPAVMEIDWVKYYTK